MVLFDFEAPGLADSWQIVHRGHAERTTCEVGSCLHVEPEPGMRLVTTDIPSDWSAVGALDFRVWATSETTIEVGLSRGDGSPGGWRHKVDLPSDACLEVHLDLGWFRRNDGPVVAWKDVGKLSLVFASEGEVWLDDIQIDLGTPSLTAEEIAKVTGGRVTTAATAVVISDVGDLDAEALVEQLERVEQRVRRDLPWLPPAKEPIPLVVMADVVAYSATVDRLARAFGAWTSPPEASGFTMEGIAISSWDPVKGIGRPVYVHEYVHALVSRATGLSNDGSWLHEGLASWFQQGFNPQANLGEEIRGSVATGLPIRELSDGHRIRIRDYGAALSVVGTLLEVPRWSGILEAVVVQAEKTGSTSLLDLGVDLDALDADRRAWADQRFPL